MDFNDIWGKARDLGRYALDRTEAKYQLDKVMMVSEEFGRERLRELHGRLTPGQWRELILGLEDIAIDIRYKYLPRGRKAANLAAFARGL